MNAQKLLPIFLVSFTLFWGTTITLSQNFWEQTNSLVGGDVTALAISSNSHIFAGAEGNIYRSTNNGDSWTNASIGIPDQPVNQIGINSTGHIFVCTFGLYRSTDNGESWNEVEISSSWTAQLSDIAFNPSGHIFICGAMNGVYRSTDNGDTWTQQNNGLGSSVGTLSINSDGHIFAGTYNNVYRSTDNGESWIERGTGLPGYSVNCFCITSVGHIFVGIGYQTLNAGVFRSTNNGDTWIEVTNGLLDPYGNSPGINTFAINSSDQIFTGTGKGVFRTTNNGENWVEINNGLTDNYGNTLSAIALAMSLSNHIFTGTINYGVFHSINNGDNWTETNTGLTAVFVRGFSINSQGNIFACAKEGVFRSPDNGASWTEINNGLISNISHRVDPVNTVAINSSDIIFIGTDPYWSIGEGPIFRSTNNGDNWTRVSNGLPNNEASSFVVNSSDHLFVGFNSYVDGGVFRSTDSGDTWVEINNGLTFQEISSLAINSEEHIYAGTNYGSIFRSTDNGENWTDLGYISSPHAILSIAFTPNGYIFFGAEEDGIYRSTNNGSSWTRVFTASQAYHFIPIVVNSIGHIFIGTSSEATGVWRSTNNGSNWEQINTGLNEKNVQSLSFIPEYRLLAGTAGAGVFLSLSTTSVEEITYGIPSSYSLGQNYPNPFNPSTTIKYQIPELSFITLKVFDVLGNEIVTLVNEEKPIGHYQINWNAENLPSGIYFYRLRTGSFVETKKMILIK